MKTLYIFLIFLICINLVSSITDAQRERNNRLLQEMEEKGEIIQEVNYADDLNPFFVLGFLTIGIIILVYILIRVVNRDRL